MMTPEFVKKEILVEKQAQEAKLGGGDIKQTIGIVKYVGAKAENYKVGDKILFDMAAANREITIFEKPLLRIENEDFVICRIVDNE